ncbi:MAG: hypothetical protein M3R17_12830 [Bacteroidota bacterium]|nr:hypothetical protein [Bacteroidota bacterium]
MEINEETYGLFDRYLTGNLSGEEKVMFEKELSLDDSLRDEFQWVNLAASEIRMNGRSILKKQLAEIGTAIPTSAFEKYSPSIRKSFFKKWWWIIAIVAVAIGLAFGWFIMNQHLVMEQEESDHASSANVPKAQDDRADPGIRGTLVLRPHNVTDTLLKKAPASPFGAPAAPESTVKLAMDSIIDATFDLDCYSFTVSVLPHSPVFYNKENGKIYVMTNADYVISPTSSNKIALECCPQKTRPAFYIYNTLLTLSGTYADTSGLRFYQNGNTITMTDGRPGYFILEKGEDQKPLVRVNVSAESKKTSGDTAIPIINGR